MRSRWKSIKAARCGAVVVAAALALTACTGDGGGGGDSSDQTGTKSRVAEPKGDPTKGGELVVGLEAETKGWSPWNDRQGISGQTVSRTFYDSLMELDADGVPQPFLAESLVPNDDFTVYTLTLREGITFHDGEPLTAEAVAMNLAEARTPGSLVAGNAEPIADVKVTGDLTLDIEMTAPNTAFPDVLATPVGYIASPKTIKDGTVSTKPVGTGPFVFTSWQRDQQLVVVRNDDYWQPEYPYLDQVTFRPITDEDARKQSLLAGDIDVLQSLRPSVLASLREEPDLNLYENTGNYSNIIRLNHAVPPFDDLRVRKAWAHAINPDELIAVSGGTGISTVAKGLFNPTSPWYDERIEKFWPSTDLDAAQEHLDDYMNDPERSDGKKVGAPVEVTFNSTADPSSVEVASLYQDAVGKIGMKMEIETMEQAALSAATTGTPPNFEGDYQASFGRQGTEGDPDWLVEAFAPGANPGNTANFENKEFYDYLIKARTTADLDERRELYFQANKILAEEVVFTASSFAVSVLASKSNIFGFDNWKLPDGTVGVGHPSAAGILTQVWVED